DVCDERVSEWVRRIREGDRSSFRELFLALYEPLCNFCWRYVRSTHVAEELVQDVFMEAWEARRELDPDQNVRSYLYQCVRNKALNKVKHRELAAEHNQKIEWLQPSPVTQRHSVEEDSEFVRVARQAIEDLPDGARRIYKLSRKDGLTYREIAGLLDISPKTVESQMSRALKLLREAL
ncbi:RNA polymerase sigma-70 factor, partial [Halalkalibaculum sp. DA384]|uniref:RNA polymerase sigma-70 factor n=2 Tax=unclassified Halalkalibaculum TaxID=2964617 RepID=UPI003754FBD7